jgi:hypothetical protein
MEKQHAPKFYLFLKKTPANSRQEAKLFARISEAGRRPIETGRSTWHYQALAQSHRTAYEQSVVLFPNLVCQPLTSFLFSELYFTT